MDTITNNEELIEDYFVKEEIRNLILKNNKTISASQKFISKLNENEKSPQDKINANEVEEDNKLYSAIKLDIMNKIKKNKKNSILNNLQSITNKSVFINGISNLNKKYNDNLSKKNKIFQASSSQLNSDGPSTQGNTFYNSIYNTIYNSTIKILEPVKSKTNSLNLNSIKEFDKILNQDGTALFKTDSFCNNKILDKTLHEYRSLRQSIDTSQENNNCRNTINFNKYKNNQINTERQEYPKTNIDNSKFNSNKVKQVETVIPNKKTNTKHTKHIDLVNSDLEKIKQKIKKTYNQINKGISTKTQIEKQNTKNNVLEHNSVITKISPVTINKNLIPKSYDFNRNESINNKLDSKYNLNTVSSNASNDLINNEFNKTNKYSKKNLVLNIKYSKKLNTQNTQTPSNLNTEGDEYSPKRKILNNKFSFNKKETKIQPLIIKHKLDEERQKKIFDEGLSLQQHKRILLDQDFYYMSSGMTDYASIKKIREIINKYLAQSRSENIIYENGEKVLTTKNTINEYKDEKLNQKVNLHAQMSSTANSSFLFNEFNEFKTPTNN